MQDDFLSAMTQEVKEEVINNYLYERRLIEEQINYVKELGEHTIQIQGMLYRRFARMYDLLMKSEFINEFVILLGLKELLLNGWLSDDPEYRKNVRFIKVRGLTDRSKFKKLFLESYRRLYNWNNQYVEAYGDLLKECDAVNKNLKKFEDNYDILTILNFLKNMDVEEITKKHFMGDNFAPEEIASIEKTMRFKPVSIKQFNLIPPSDLPDPDDIHDRMGSLANSVYGRYSENMKTLIK
ncbi:MAG: hypothetical protein KKH84_02265 [Proteobacteria bacterium]|nr:hypothetical protein [Pseudomonadota bacterium]